MAEVGPQTLKLAAEEGISLRLLATIVEGVNPMSHEEIDSKRESLAKWTKPGDRDKDAHVKRNSLAWMWGLLSSRPAGTIAAHCIFSESIGGGMLTHHRTGSAAGQIVNPRSCPLCRKVQAGG